MSRTKYIVTLNVSGKLSAMPLPTATALAHFLRLLVRGIKPDEAQTVTIKRIR